MENIPLISTSSSLHSTPIHKYRMSSCGILNRERIVNFLATNKLHKELCSVTVTHTHYTTHTYTQGVTSLHSKLTP